MALATVGVLVLGRDFRGASAGALFGGGGGGSSGGAGHAVSHDVVRIAKIEAEVRIG